MMDFLQIYYVYEISLFSRNVFYGSCRLYFLGYSLCPILSRLTEGAGCDADMFTQSQ